MQCDNMYQCTVSMYRCIVPMYQSMHCINVPMQCSTRSAQWRPGSSRRCVGRTRRGTEARTQRTSRDFKDLKDLKDKEGEKGKKLSRRRSLRRWMLVLNCHFYFIVANGKVIFYCDYCGPHQLKGLTTSLSLSLSPPPQ